MSDTVKFKWNDKEIEAKKGSNLLKAALDNGIDVAHYCYHAGLSVAGVCRMCMVEQNGVPRPFPACNATVNENIEVRNDTPKIKEAVSATLQFHLLNHPLDCPVCDQAGECGLQDNYMLHGKYDSQMTDKKVHKEKVQDIGCDVMLDAERCILCSRCVRFTGEVTKSSELGILNRGDHAEITVLKELNNDYAQNLVDICPVGALTSKDFRFKQRVWFLEDVHTTCIGCEVGCSVKVSQNKNGAYRVKPVLDEAVNGYWMCDDGREIYKHVSSPTRLHSLVANQQSLFVPAEEASLKEKLKNKNVKLILSTHLTNEEYRDVFTKIKDLNLAARVEVALYRSPDVGPIFDGILKRGNKNANLKGAIKNFEQFGFDASDDHCKKLMANVKDSDAVLFVLPEMSQSLDHLETAVKQISKAALKCAITPNEEWSFVRTFDFLCPVPTFLEKNGTMLNYQGLERTLVAGMSYGDNSKTVASYLDWV